MRDTHEVISSFLDDEPFSANELAEALSHPEGRALLIDLIALRDLAQTEGPASPRLAIDVPWRSSVRKLVAVAAVLVALVGGYLVGERRTERAASVAPPPTRVVPAPAAWQNVPVGAVR